MDDLVSWVGIGAAAVLVMHFLLRLEQPLGLATTLCLGVAGAVLGGFLAQFVDMGTLRDAMNVDWISLVITVFGAVGVVLLVGILRR